MKNLILMIGAIAIFCFAGCGQTGNNLPAAVKTAFTQKFPDATGVKWDKESDNEWEAEFKMNGVEYTASFDNKGAWMETEYEISADDIPEAVKMTLEREYANYTVEEPEVSETTDGKVYEFELKSGEEEIKVAIDMNGNVLKKTQGEEEDEEGEEAEEEGEEDDD
jgi:hypothetical protein